MKLALLLFCLFLSFPFNSHAENNFSLEIGINKLNYQKPIKGIGKAGILQFKTVNLNNQGIVLNLNNTNNNFDAEIFVRPTFLGFTTQFGNFGLPIDEKSLLNEVRASSIENTYLILDDSELNISGSILSVTNPENKITLQNYRLYCQGVTSFEHDTVIFENPTNNILKNCFKFLILNATSSTANQFASIEFSGKNQNDKIYLKGNLNSFDLRSKEILTDIRNLQFVSNDTYIINTQNLKLNCAKDEDLVSLDLDKIKKACTNNLKVLPFVANLRDDKNKTTFSLDLLNLQIVNQMAYADIKNAIISDPASSTYLTSAVLNCKKSTDTDVLNLPEIINDCLSYSKLSLAELRSTKNLDSNSKDSSTKNILLSSNNGNLMISADVRFLGANHRISISGKGSMNIPARELSLAITDVKLPFGINSVKLLMYFLKKSIVSKTVTISGNVIKIIF